MTPESSIRNNGKEPRQFVKVLARIVIVIIALALPLIVLEIALQTLGPILPGNYSAHLYLEPHPIYGRFHIPNSTGWVRTDEYKARIDINSRGLREREIPYEKPAGTRRIVVLGDSFVEGAEVTVDRTVTRQLEQILNAQGNQPTQVVNAGVRAFGTGQEYLLMQNEALKYEPDLILFFFYDGNDVSNNSPRIEHNVTDRRKPYFTVGRDGEPRMLSFRPKRAASLSIVEQLRRSSMLFSVLDTGVFSRFFPAENEQDPEADRNDNAEAQRPDQQMLKYELPVFAAEPTGEWVESWEVTEALLAAASRDATAAGVPFLVVGAPTKWEIYVDDWTELLERNRLIASDWSLDEPNNRINEITRRRGIPFLDLRPDLRARSETSPRLYFRGDVHWTESGHRTVAEILAATPGVH